MSQSVEKMQLKSLAPRHLEIMDRLMAGQKQREISKDMGINEGRLSIIVNSPLFKLRMREKLLKREEKVLAIQENILMGAEIGTALHNTVINGQFPTEIKLRAAATMANLGLRMIQPLNQPKNGNNHPIEEEGKSYEERLREVTFREVVKTPIENKEDELEIALNSGIPQLPLPGDDLPEEEGEEGLD